MKYCRYLFFFIIIFCSSVSSQNKGHLFVMGGGEWPDYLIERFIELAGGDSSLIIIIPSASSEPIETAQKEIDIMKRLGCINVRAILTGNINADADSNLMKLRNAKAVFFSGGDQNRLTASLMNTKLIELIKSIYNSGGVIGGTSAGAAAMSKIMITGDELLNQDSTNSFAIIKKGNIKTAQGLGFIQNAVIDQHFISRRRHNRLISVILEHPELLGIGIDESTACIFNPDSTFEVLGENLVAVYNAFKAENISIDKNSNLAADNISLSILKSGDLYNLQTQKVVHAR